MNWKKNLNPQQLEAVCHSTGPLLVLAGPGSGKTRVLTHRIAYLVRDRGVTPQSVLAITFTNKAAGEMRTRVHKLLGPAARDMWIGTFHATCARILRRHIDRLGFERNFVIYDESDQSRVIKAILKARGVADNTVRPAMIKSLLDKAKNQYRAPLEGEDWLPADRTVLEPILTDYATALKNDNALDFGDLITFVLRLFDQTPDIMDSFRYRFPFVLVDEYQDTNRAQHELLKRLAPPEGDVCVVGDDDQSIYRWRGAEVENMLGFQKDFPDTRIITLEQNYRSSENIIRAAEAVARHNSKRLDKKLWTKNAPGDPLFFLETSTADGEADFVAEEIRSLEASGDFGHGDIAVFYRTNAQSRPFEERFVAHGIPYVVIGSLRFYERAEIKDLTAYLRVLYNPRDSASLGRILNTPPRGIGAVTQGRLTTRAMETRMSLWETLEGELAGDRLKGAARHKLATFHSLILEMLSGLEGTGGLAGLLQDILRKTEYRDFLAGQPDGERKLENVDELIRTAKNFDTPRSAHSTIERLEEFCERISLISSADTSDGRGQSVSLMTLHCAKGLEFPLVFLTGMEDGLMPHTRSSVSPESLSEERRLCYVGMTRAKHRLYMSRVRTRMIHGDWRPTRPSPFLRDIPGDLVKVVSSTGDLFSTTTAAPRRNLWEDPGDPFPSPASSFPALTPSTDESATPSYRVGDRVLHESLGLGTVRKVEGSGPREKIVVQFENRKIRKLMARNAPVERVPSE